jgi:cyclopropane-fatty-acyl-phospholipid synthase
MIKRAIFKHVLDWVELGMVPDVLVRRAIRRLCVKRLDEIDQGDCEANLRQLETFVAQMNQSCIAPIPDVANEQHYTVPPALFELILGQRLKYSSCFWPPGVSSLDEAEDAALQATCERAELADGMRVLELGCGWGAVSLWIAEHYPHCEITAVSNSPSQREYILAKAQQRGLSENLTVITADMNEFDIAEQFDRVISLEMFEHMRNYQALLQRISHWLTPEGKLFIHIFCHRELAYEFVDRGETDWMSRHFFSGGIMPSDQLLFRFQEHLRVARQWRWDGTHYQKTAEGWVANMDRNREKTLKVLSTTYGEKDAVRWFNRWRLLFLAGAELFGYQQGQQWWVSHYLLEQQSLQSSSIELWHEVNSLTETVSDFAN